MFFCISFLVQEMLAKIFSHKPSCSTLLVYYGDFSVFFSAHKIVFTGNSTGEFNCLKMMTVRNRKCYLQCGTGMCNVSRAMRLSLKGF